MKTRAFYFTTALITIFSFGCINDESIKEGSVDLTYKQNDLGDSFIKPPFLDRDIEQEKFTINAQEDAEIISESGSKIKIYKNSIIDDDGNIVKGEVEIEYRDFHNPIEIFLSGIPMEYDSAGVKQVFETAGMFELKAYQKGNKLSLKEGAKIDVDLISTSNETRFNFYQFDEVTRKWNYVEKEMNIETKPKQKQSLIIDESEDIPRPVKQNESLYAFDLEVNKEQFPELLTYKGTIFQVKQKGGFDPLYYNVQWDKAKIDKINNKHYQLELFREDTSIIVDVQPVVKTTKYKEAIKQYHTKVAAREKLNKERSDFDIYATSLINYNSAYSAQFEVKRQFQVNGFGIYNVDQPKVNPNGEVESIYVNEKGNIMKQRSINYYVVNLNQNSLVSLYNKPKYYKKAKNILWAILNDDSMIIVSPQEIDNIKNKKLSAIIYPLDEGLALLEEVCLRN